MWIGKNSKELQVGAGNVVQILGRELKNDNFILRYKLGNTGMKATMPLEVMEKEYVFQVDIEAADETREINIDQIDNVLGLRDGLILSLDRVGEVPVEIKGNFIVISARSVLCLEPTGNPDELQEKSWLIRENSAAVITYEGLERKKRDPRIL